METTKLIEEKIAYVSWETKRLEIEKLLLYERLTLINTILKERKENKQGE
mgnify:CR=1 FL=1